MMILVIFAPFVYNITLSKQEREGKRYDTTGSVMLLSFINLKTPWISTEA